MKEKVREKIFEEFRNRDYPLNYHWDDKDVIFFCSNLTQKEKQFFDSVINDLIKEGIFEPREHPRKALVLTQKGFETIY